MPSVNGVAWVTCASQEIPATSVPRMMPSATSTRRALFPSGGRNAPTASLTASMPVSEAPPLANARSRVKIRAALTMPLVPAPMGKVPCRACGSIRGRSPNISLTRPTTIISSTMPTNRKVGTANALPASRIPRRLPKHSSRITAIVISRL